MDTLGEMSYLIQQNLTPFFLFSIAKKYGLNQGEFLSMAHSNEIAVPWNWEFRVNELIEEIPADYRFKNKDEL